MCEVSFMGGMSPELFMLWAVAMGAFAGWLVVRKLRPKLIHQMSFRQIEVDRTQFDEFFNTAEGKALVAHILSSDEKYKEFVKSLL